MIEVRVNVPEKALLSQMESQFTDAVEHGLDEVANLAERAKDRQVGKTYARSIPKTKRGKPRWSRSGAWRRGQRTLKAKGRRTLVDTGPAARPIKNYPQGYAQRLATLNTERRNAAAPNAAEIITPQAPRVMEQAIKNELRIS